MAHAALQLNDYENMADGVVATFFDKKSSLSENVLKVAQENDLNPEQIKRLVELSNTKAFLKIFKDKSDGDKMVDFDVADSDDVIKKYMSGDSPGKTISITKVTITRHGDGDMNDFPDMMGKHRDGEKKVASDSAKAFFVEEPELAEKVAAAPEFRTRDKYAQVLNMRRASEEFMNRVYDSEHSYNDGLDKVASEFCKLYGPDYAEFEKEAQLRYGADDPYVKYALEDIRKCIKWTKPMGGYSPSRVKIAALKTAEMETFERMVQLKKVQVKYAECIKTANRKLEDLLK